MHPDTSKQEWDSMSQHWIKEVREGRNANRSKLLDEPMLQACGVVEGSRILDCGCGEGRFCRMLVKRGAKYVLGLDLCESMIIAAKELQSTEEEYKVADVQDLSFIGDAEFDLVVSYLNQNDLPDFKANNREVQRVLKTDGLFVVANLHPMQSANGIWHKNEAGEKDHVILSQYFEEGERHWKMLGTRLTNYHRSLSTYIDSYIDAGFIIERILEPTPTAESISKYRELEDEIKVPTFIIYILRKR
ncbi:MAG: class I SAM-dependent methyltransferase [Candidatus Cloacimonetes bacterium]|nr:class I SAM-dependent methyltransferase [Candidatus Cloacimonadota bacterium]